MKGRGGGERGGEAKRGKGRGGQGKTGEQRVEGAGRLVVGLLLPLGHRWRRHLLGAVGVPCVGAPGVRERGDDKRRCLS